MEGKPIQAMASKLNLWPKVKGMLLIEVMERNASSNAEIGRLWKFDGYHDSLGEVGVGRFVIWPHKNMFIVPGCLVFSFKEYIKTSLGDQAKDKKKSKTKLYIRGLARYGESWERSLPNPPKDPPGREPMPPGFSPYKPGSPKREAGPLARPRGQTHLAIPKEVTSPDEIMGPANPDAEDKDKRE
ncbi:hypothetical protein QJS10_CPB15g00640 [Acorus calamus]|uniref:Uncharacterized protein n=1 Tax=Acorus calamus TaxID=4465 RepID=A0AAV9D7I0_ACOCL|nr:hypothetical protein QJS10_CPB15g00640 [Acorus calamus]